MPLSKNVDLSGLRSIEQFSFYFRYPLHHSDFHEVRAGHRLLGYFAAKPLYGHLTPEGKVDRSSGYNGEIAIIFLPSPVHFVRKGKLLFTHLPPEMITNSEGHRNWLAILSAAKERIISSFERNPS